MVVSSIPADVARKVKVAMVCESFPDERGAEILSDPGSTFVANTIDAFNSAGLAVSSMDVRLPIGHQNDPIALHSTQINSQATSI